MENWTLTINIMNGDYDEALESITLEFDSLGSCIIMIKIFKEKGILFSKDNYYQFIIE